MKIPWKLFIVSLVLFFMLWVAYETKPQEITLDLMGLTLAVIVLFVAWMAVHFFWWRAKD